MLSILFLGQSLPFLPLSQLSSLLPSKFRNSNYLILIFMICDRPSMRRVRNCCQVAISSSDTSPRTFCFRETFRRRSLSHSKDLERYDGKVAWCSVVYKGVLLYLGAEKKVNGAIPIGHPKQLSCPKLEHGAWIPTEDRSICRLER